MTRWGRRTVGGVAWAVLAVPLAGLDAPASWYEQRRERIESTPAVFKSWDNPALYAMFGGEDEMLSLEQALEAWDEPAWAAWTAEPERWRDRPAVVRGRFVESETRRLDRPSFVVDGRLQQWAVQWGPGDDDVAIVLLPAASIRRTGDGVRDHEIVERRVPLPNARVAVPGRFLGMWETLDRAGESFAFPVLVAMDAAVYDGAEHALGSSGQAAAIAVVLLLAGIGAVVWWRVNKRGWESRNHRRRREALHDDDDDGGLDDAFDEGVADDPVEALDRLAHRD